MGRRNALRILAVVRGVAVPGKVLTGRLGRSLRPSGPAGRVLGWLLALSVAFGGLTGLVGPARPAQAAAVTFTVNTTADTVDANPGDGVCADSSGACSLRAAVMEANALGGGPHTIVLQAGQTYTLTIGQLSITSDITIQGNGAIIQRDLSLTCNLNGTKQAGKFRIFYVSSAGKLSLGSLTVKNGCADGGDPADNSGGGIYSEGTLNVTNSTVSENMAYDSGGGIGTFYGITRITDSTISGNSAVNGLGGGILQFAGQAIITNSTISGNQSSSPYFGGGGIAATFYPLLSVSFVTIAKNNAPMGSGIYLEPVEAFLSIKNSVVADNTGSGNCFKPLSASGVNFATDDSCGSGFTQVTLSQLNLQPLADNGGPTPTHALGPGSVAIDAASECTDLRNNPVTTDQRGVTRPQGARCDAGAFEREAAGYRLYLPLVVKGP